MDGVIRFTHEDGEIFDIQDGIAVYRAGDLADSNSNFSEYTIVVESEGDIQSAGFSSRSVSLRERRLELEPKNGIIQLTDHGKRSTTIVEDLQGNETEVPTGFSVPMKHGATIDFAHNSNIIVKIDYEKSVEIKDLWRVGVTTSIEQLQTFLAEWQQYNHPNELEYHELEQLVERLEYTYLEYPFVAQEGDNWYTDCMNLISELKDDPEEGYFEDGPTAEDYMSKLDRLTGRLKDLRDKV